MKWECFVCGTIRNNCYVVWNDSTMEAVSIDAPIGSRSVLGEFLKKSHVKLSAVLLTHGHWDHIAEAAILKEEFGVPLHGHDGDLPMFLNPDAMASYAVPGVAIRPCKPDVSVKDGDMLHLLGIEWVVRSVAGHTPGGVVYYLPSENLLFSGDSLFHGSVGRSDLPGGDGKLLIEQLKSRLLTLPKNVKVLPGHGTQTTIGNELLSNPYL